MIRIMTADELTSTTITVDGTLSGEGIEPVQMLFSGAFKRELRHLAAESVDLTANGIYSSYIVDEIQSAGLNERRCSR